MIAADYLINRCQCEHTLRFVKRNRIFWLLLWFFFFFLVSPTHWENLIGLKFQISCILNIKYVLIGCILAFSENNHITFHWKIVSCLVTSCCEVIQETEMNVVKMSQWQTDFGAFVCVLTTFKYTSMLKEAGFMILVIGKHFVHLYTHVYCIYI